MLLIALLAGGLLAPLSLSIQPENSGAAKAAESKAQLSACPLPIPECLPEYVFDFKKCRCVPRP
jgi:hypothetical protein